MAKLGILKRKLPTESQLLVCLVLWKDGNVYGGDGDMPKRKKNPSKAGVSAASVKGNAGPTVELDGGGKRNSQNNQYKK